jgi:Recombinase
MQRMQMIFEFTRSHSESKAKQQRLSHRWLTNRDAIRKGEYKIATPRAWIDVVRVNKRPTGYKLNDHAATVKLIYKLCLQGAGINKICTQLDADGVPTFRGGQRWSPSSVKKVLHNEAVTGVLQLHTTVDTAGVVKSIDRQPVGQPIKDYYPRVVSDAQYREVQVVLAGRRISGTRKDRGAATNLLTGLVYLATDGSRMNVINKGFGHRLAGGRPRIYIDYARFENAVLFCAGRADINVTDNRKFDKELRQCPDEDFLQSSITFTMNSATTVYTLYQTTIETLIQLINLCE